MPSEVSTASADQDIAARLLQRERELADAQQREAATAEVLRVIGSSPNNLGPVFQAIVANAARLCDAAFSAVAKFEGGLLQLVAVNKMSPEETAAYHTVFPRLPGRDFIMGRAFIDRQPVHVADIEADPDYDPRTLATLKAAAPYRTFLGIPIIRGGEPIGTIGCGRREVKPFTDAQVALVQTFADQAVIAIENARLFEAEQLRTHELADALEQQTATSELLKVMGRSTFNLQPVFDALAENAIKLCEADRAMIFRFDGSCLQVVAAYNISSELRAFHERNPIEPGRGSCVGRMALERRTIHIHDVRTDPEYTFGGQQVDPYRTLLAVPILRAGELLGAINIVRYEVLPFTESQIALMETFADQAVISIENTRLFEEAQARTQQLSEALEQQTTTAEILRVISSSPTDTQPVFDIIMQSAVRLCGARHALVYRLEGEMLQLVGHYNFSPETLEPYRRTLPHRLRESRTLVAQAMLSGRVVEIDDIELDPGISESVRQLARSAGYRSVIAVPMMRDGRPLGAIALTNIDENGEPNPFSREQLRLLETFAGHVGIAIENTQLFEEVQARTGDLTRSVAELKALGEVGRAVSSTLDLKVVLKTIVSRAVDLSGTDAGSIFHYREEVGAFELGESSGFEEEVVARLRKLDIAAKDTALGEAIAKRKPIQVPDATQRPNTPLGNAVIDLGMRAALIVPLLGAERPLGALTLRRRQPGEFPEAVVSLMQSFANQSVIALENARLFEEIAQKSRELEIASQHKSQFVANMSHELRTPLAAILGYAELMQEGFYEPLGKKSTDALTRIRSNGKHLLGLINTVLDIAKIESGQFSLNLGEYAIESVVETVRAATESLAETKKLALTTDVAKQLPFGLGDEQRLTQVLLNLVGNAIKFTDMGEVRVSARTANSHFNVSVTDTGPGIPEEHLARVFEQFHQVDNSNTKAKGGTGLGLAISKQIVEMHGGRIWVESTVGKGSTFQMQLPIRAESKKSIQ